jgi:hypothetical protein
VTSLQQKARACDHAEAQPLEVDNHGTIYIAAGNAEKPDPAWCPRCGALRLRHLPWHWPLWLRGAAPP